jgi:hypothetical protein
LGANLLAGKPYPDEGERRRGDDPLTVHKFRSIPAFVFEAHPVIRVDDAVRGELEVIAWRDGLKGK